MEFPTAYIKAIEKMAENHEKKGDSWKYMDAEDLAYLLGKEWAEFKADGSTTDELLDIMNFAAMLYDKLTNKTLKDV